MYIDMWRNAWFKWECWKFYDAWEWQEKVAFATFYWRAKVHKDEDRNILILPGKKKQESKVMKGRFDEEMNFWLKTKWDKPDRHVFYGRLVRGYPKEEAVLMGDKREKVMKQKTRATNTTPHLKKITKPSASAEEDYTWIDITYPKEVARVIRKEFNNVISELEWRLRQVDEKDDVKVLTDKLELAKAELNLFNSYNH